MKTPAFKCPPSVIPHRAATDINRNCILAPPFWSPLEPVSSSQKAGSCPDSRPVRCYPRRMGHRSDPVVAPDLPLTDAEAGVKVHGVALSRMVSQRPGEVASASVRKAANPQRQGQYGQNHRHGGYGDEEHKPVVRYSEVRPVGTKYGVQSRTTRRGAFVRVCGTGVGGRRRR